MSPMSGKNKLSFMLQEGCPPPVLLLDEPGSSLSFESCAQTTADPPLAAAGAGVTLKEWKSLSVFSFFCPQNSYSKSLMFKIYKIQLQKCLSLVIKSEVHHATFTPPCPNRQSVFACYCMIEKMMRFHSPPKQEEEGGGGKYKVL